MSVQAREIWTTPKGGEEYADPLGLVRDCFIAELGSIVSVVVECKLPDPVNAQAHAYPHIIARQREFFTILSQYPAMEQVVQQSMIDLNRRQRRFGIPGLHSDI